MPDQPRLAWFNRFAQSTAESPYTLQWETLSSKLPLPTGDLDPMKHTIPWTHRSPQTKRHLYRFSRLSTDDRRMGDLNPHLIHGPLGPAKSSTQKASRSVQPFLQGSLVWQTDHATPSLTIDRIYVRSTTMRSNNSPTTLRSINRGEDTTQTAVIQDDLQ